MGETLGIAHNVFEKMERERDRKERLKKYEEWVKEQEKRKLRLKDIQTRIKEAERLGIYTPDTRSPSFSKKGASANSLNENEPENDKKEQTLKKYEEWRREKKTSLFNIQHSEIPGASPSKRLGMRSASAAKFSSKDVEFHMANDFEDINLDIYREQDPKKQVSKPQKAHSQDLNPEDDPSDLEIGLWSKSATGLLYKDDDDENQFDSLEQLQDNESKKAHSHDYLQETGDETEDPININKNPLTILSKRFMSTPGIPLEENLNGYNMSKRKSDNPQTIDWIKNNLESSPKVLADHSELTGSKIKMSSFIGSSSVRTVSVSKDLDQIHLDEKIDRGISCGKCILL